MGCHWPCFEMKKLRFSHLMSSASWEGLSCCLLPPDSSSDSLSWALAQVPEICSVRVLGSQSSRLEPCPWSVGPQTWPLTSLEGCGPCGWDWGWVPRDLNLECRSSCFFFFFFSLSCFDFFFFFYCEKNLRLNSEGCLDYRELTCPLSHWVISTVIWATLILFFYFHILKIFSPN